MNGDRSGLAKLAGLFVIGTLLACGPQVGGSAQGFGAKGDGERVDDPEIAALRAGSVAFSSEYRDEELAVPMAQTPDFDGAPSFGFCSDPVRGQAANLTNAAWLAYFAITEYSHLAVINPEFRKLGFGTAADDDWSECALGLRQLRRLECVAEKREDGVCAASCLPASLPSGDALHAAAAQPGCVAALEGGELQLGCAARWLDERVAKATGTERLAGETASAGIAARFQRWLIRTTHADRKIKYFAGGSFSTEDGRRSFDEGSTQAVYAEHPDKNIVIVSFRGTEGDAKLDILTDADFRKRPLTAWGFGDPSWGEGHRGFLAAYHSIERQLLTVIGRLRSRDAPPGIWVTGHSLGGALATLFSAKLLELLELGYRIDFEGMYSFGSPRVGNETFARKVDGLARTFGVPLVRIKHGSDIVTRVPKEFMGYRHIGQVLHLPDLGDVTAKGPIQLSDGDDATFGSAGDHSMIHYYRRVAEARRRGRNGVLDRCN